MPLLDPKRKGLPGAKDQHHRGSRHNVLLESSATQFSGRKDAHCQAECNVSYTSSLLNENHYYISINLIIIYANPSFLSVYQISEKMSTKNTGLFFFKEKTHPQQQAINRPSSLQAACKECRQTSGRICKTLTLARTKYL